MTHSVTENEAGEEVNKSVPDASNPGNEAQVDEESTERANQTTDINGAINNIQLEEDSKMEVQNLDEGNVAGPSGIILEPEKRGVKRKYPLFIEDDSDDEDELLQIKFLKLESTANFLSEISVNNPRQVAELDIAVEAPLPPAWYEIEEPAVADRDGPSAPSPPIIHPQDVTGQEHHLNLVGSFLEVLNRERAEDCLVVAENLNRTSPDQISVVDIINNDDFSAEELQSEINDYEERLRK